MSEPTCETCKLGEMVFSSSWGEKKLRCMRKVRFRNGDYDDPLGVGRDPRYEREAREHSHRWPGDQCGPSGKNWRPKS